MNKKILLSLGIFVTLLTGCSKNTDNTSESLVSSEEIVTEKKEIETTEEITTEITTEEAIEEEIINNKYEMQGIEFSIPDYWNKNEEDSDDDTCLFLLDSEIRETFWVKCAVIPEIMKIDLDTLEQLPEDEVINSKWLDTWTIDSEKVSKFGEYNMYETYFSDEETGKKGREIVIAINTDAEIRCNVFVKDEEKLNDMDIFLESLNIDKYIENLEKQIKDEEKNRIVSKTDDEAADFIRRNLLDYSFKYTLADRSKNVDSYICALAYDFNEVVGSIGFDVYEDGIPKQYACVINNYHNLHDQLEAVAMVYLAMAADPKLDIYTAKELYGQLLDGVKDDGYCQLENNGLVYILSLGRDTMGLSITDKRYSTK